MLVASPAFKKTKLCHFCNVGDCSMGQTTINLLTRDGSVAVTFAAVLTPEQYARLYVCVQEASTKPQMSDCIAMVASEGGVQAVVDGTTLGADWPNLPLRRRPESGLTDEHSQRKTG